RTASTAAPSRVRPPTSNSGFVAPSTRDARPPARRIAPWRFVSLRSLTVRGCPSARSRSGDGRLTGAQPVAALAAGLRDDAHVLDRRRLVEPLHHVEDRERGD